MNAPAITVVVPTHNPHRGRLERAMAGLRMQKLPRDRWELVVVDNASTDVGGFAGLDLSWHPAARVVREETLGLAHARLRGFAEADSPLVVLVDDDNVLAREHLFNAVHIADEHPTVGVFGGRCIAEFERTPAPWTAAFHSNLAIVDHGRGPLVGAFEEGSHEYPKFSPVGAGMVLRAECARIWAEATKGRGSSISDRCGDRLSSAGDCDIVLTILEAGWQVGYFPQLSLVHLIPPSRVEREYLARLARGISKSWIEVLDLHGIRPWKPVPPALVPVLKARAWLRMRAWSGDAEFVRWSAACGNFEGRATLR